MDRIEDLRKKIISSLNCYIRHTESWMLLTQSNWKLSNKFNFFICTLCIGMNILGPLKSEMSLELCWYFSSLYFLDREENSIIFSFHWWSVPKSLWTRVWHNTKVCSRRCDGAKDVNQKSGKPQCIVSVRLKGPGSNFWLIENVKTFLKCSSFQIDSFCRLALNFGVWFQCQCIDVLKVFDNKTLSQSFLFHCFARFQAPFHVTCIKHQ